MTKKAKRIKLPVDLYDISPAEQPTIITPGNDQFGGADISIVSDAKETLFAGFTARELATGIFGFVIWNLTLNRKVPYAPFCNARGELNDQGRWAAWNDQAFFYGAIPGFVPFPRTVVPQVPPTGALAALYQGVYTAKDFDTPTETALRAQKQLDALQEGIELLIAAGVLRR